MRVSTDYVSFPIYVYIVYIITTYVSYLASSRVPYPSTRLPYEDIPRPSSQIHSFIASFEKLPQAIPTTVPVLTIPRITGLCFLCENLGLGAGEFFPPVGYGEVAESIVDSGRKCPHTVLIGR